MQKKLQGKRIKNFIGKIIDSALCFSVAMTAMTNCAYAAPIKGDAADSSAMWYWQENFNDYTEGSYSYNTGTKPDCVTIPSTHKNVYVQSREITAESDYALEIKGDKLASGNQQVKIVTDVCNFEKGPVAVQFDVTFLSAPQGFRMDLCDNETTTLIGNIIQTKSSKWYAYYAAANNTASQKTATTNKKYRFTASLNYDPVNKTVNVKTYVDGERLLGTVNSIANTPIEYDMDVSSETRQTALGNTLVLRFYAYKNDDVVIDNVTVRNEGSVDIADFAQINDGSAQIDISDTADYGDIISYQNAAVNLKDNYFVKQYRAADNPFLIGGQDADCTIDKTQNKKLVLNNLDSESIYIFKILNDGVITSFYGEEPSNRETVIADAGYTDNGIRGTVIYDENGEEIFLTEDGKFPETARKIVISTAEGVTFSDVSAVLGSQTVTAEYADNEYTMDIDAGLTANAQTIAISADSITKEYQIDKEEPVIKTAQCFIERFDSEELPEKLVNSAPSNITVQIEDGRLKYENDFSGGTKNLTYDFGKTVDFSLGSLLVSFDVTLNQTIKWIGTTGGSHFFYPHVATGTKNIGQTPLIEHEGLRRAITTGSLRDKIGLEGAVASVGKTYTLRALYTYNSEEESMSVLQFVGDNEMTTDTGVLAGANVYNGITKNDLKGNLKLVFAGRNFKDGGLYIDNISFTMLDEITADNLLNIENDVATIDVRQSLIFEEGSEEELTRARYVNNVEKDDIKVYRYSVSDTLMTNAEIVTDFKYSKDSFTISNLTNKNNYNYVIDIGDPQKVAAWNKKTLDNRYFKAGLNPNGIVKVLKYDVNGNLTEDSNGGKWQSDLTKVKLIFEEGYVSGSVSLNTVDAQPNEDNTEWVLDFANSPLKENTLYVLKVDGAEYGRVTTDGGKLSAAKPIINSDGGGSVYIINTTAEDKKAYLVSTFINGDGELIGSEYKKLSVPKNSADTYILPNTSAVSAEAARQEMYVLDSFEKMNLLSECAERNISEITPVQYDATTSIVMKPIDASYRTAITASIDKGKTVSIAVFGDGKNYSDAESGTENALALSAAVTVGSDGILSVPVNMESFAKGTYGVRVCMDGEVILEKELLVSHSEDYMGLIPALNTVLASGSVSEIISFTNENAVALRLEKNYDISTGSQIAELLKSKSPYSVSDPDVIETISDTYYSAVFISAVTEKKESSMEKFADNFDMFKESPLKDIYAMKYITDSVKKGVIDRISSGGVYKSTDDLKEKTADYFILSVVKNPTGPGDIKDVILQVYPDFNRTFLTMEACRSVQNKSYPTVTEVKEALRNYKPDASTEVSGGSPSFSPSASGNTGKDGAAGGNSENNADEGSTQQYEYFTDIGGFSWAKTAINSLYEKGVISGRATGQFAPESEITREEFIKLLVVLFKITKTDDNPLAFTDVTAEQWFYPYIKTAKAAGITGGMTDTLFGAGMPITRQDAAVMLARCISEYQLEEQDKTPFGDIESVSGYAQQSVSLIQRLGIINGYEDGTFRPNRFITRAEAATILYETDERIESI